MAWYQCEKARDLPAVQAYIDDLDEPQRRICQHVRDRVKADPEVVEGIAWGIPFYFRKGPFAYTSAAKTHVTVGIAKGARIDDPSGLLVTTGKSPLGKVIVKTRDPFPEAAFRDWLQKATALDDADEL